MKKLFKKIAVILLIEMYLFSSIAQAYVMPSLATPVGQEIAAAMGARGAVAGLGRVMSGLGPYGLLAGLLLPLAYDWIKNSDGTVTKPAGTAAPPNTGATLQQGQAMYVCGPNNNAYGASPADACAGRIQMYNSGMFGNYGQGSLTRCDDRYCYQVVTVNGQTYPEQQAGAWGSAGTWSGQPCTGYSQSPGGACVGIQGVPTPAQTKSPQEVAQALPDAEKVKPIPAQQMADAVNQILQDDRATNGPSAYNDTAANPVTAAQIEALRAQTGNTPKVGDLASPVGFPKVETITNPYQGNPTNPSQPITPSGIDWTLPGSTETVSKQSVPVSYTPTIFAAPTGCPAAIPFTMFGTTYNISWQPACDLMATLAPIFLATGAAAAALIFARSLKS